MARGLTHRKNIESRGPLEDRVEKRDEGMCAMLAETGGYLAETPKGSHMIPLFDIGMSTIGMVLFVLRVIQSSMYRLQDLVYHYQ
jgi:hypothetical protein